MGRQGPVDRPPVETVHAEEREQAGEFVAVPAEPRDVLVVQGSHGGAQRPDNSAARTGPPY